MSSTTHGTTPYYFVPGPSGYPVMASLGLLFVIFGATQWINSHEWGAYVLAMGMVIWLATLSILQSRAVRKLAILVCSFTEGRRSDSLFSWSGYKWMTELP